jgi:hypothetical protein
MKVFIIVVVAILLLLLFGYWYTFIRSVDLKDAKMVCLCLSKDTLSIEPAESFKYFTACQNIIHGDTIEINISETTAANHFCKPITYYDTKLDPRTKYIKIADSVIAVKDIKSCR